MTETIIDNLLMTDTLCVKRYYSLLTIVVMMTIDDQYWFDDQCCPMILTDYSYYSLKAFIVIDDYFGIRYSMTVFGDIQYWQYCVLKSIIFNDIIISIDVTNANHWRLIEEGYSDWLVEENAAREEECIDYWREEK